jgi:hypothetical protein
MTLPLAKFVPGFSSFAMSVPPYLPFFLSAGEVRRMRRELNGARRAPPFCHFLFAKIWLYHYGHKMTLSCDLICHVI